MRVIIVPTDFSENSWNAISYAIQLYKDEECTFYLFNAYTPVIYHVEYVLGSPSQFGLGDAVRVTSQGNLDSLASRIINELEQKYQQDIRIILQGEMGDIYILNSAKDLLPLSFEGSFLF